jgi:hypothetical protein
LHRNQRQTASNRCKWIIKEADRNKNVPTAKDKAEICTEISGNRLKSVQMDHKKADRNTNVPTAKNKAEICTEIGSNRLKSVQMDHKSSR